MRSLRVLALVVVTWLVAAPAAAGRHTVQRGETLEHVARAYGCSVDAVLRANRLKTTLVKAGTVVTIPACSLRSRARTRERVRPRAATDDVARARQALAVIDGATVIAASRPPEPEREDGPADGPSESIGRPWNGRLRRGERLPAGEGYKVRRPHRAFGAAHVVEHLQDAIAIVRALYPGVHTLAIGDLSARFGGKIDRHHSHQSGLDVDVGFFFHVVPEGYPDRFAQANADLDLAATWALLTAFSRTTHLAGGVQMIFLDHGVQARLYQWARRRGTPDDQLAEILQYPRGKDTLVGLVRHWPHHADHLHVRFKPRS